MAKCRYCHQEMKDGVGCTAGLGRLPNDDDEPCHDCACPPGTLHHPGCDAERCPDCGGQAISCGCEQEDEWEDDDEDTADD